jgi:hypothetical protein
MTCHYVDIRESVVFLSTTDFLFGLHNTLGNRVGRRGLDASGSG